MSKVFQKVTANRGWIDETHRPLQDAFKHGDRAG